MKAKKKLENEIYDYLVPISKFKREFNSWFRLIKSEQSVVAVTRNENIVAYMVPHNHTEKG